MTSRPHRSYGPLNTGRVLGVTAFLMLPVTLFVSKAVAPLFVIAVVLVFTLTFDSAQIRWMLTRPVALCFIAFMALGALTPCGSVEPVSSLRAAVTMELTFFGGLYLLRAVGQLPETERASFHRGILYGGIFGFSLVIFELATGALLTRGIMVIKDIEVILVDDPLLGLNPGMVALTLFIWPWLITVRNRFGGLTMACALVTGLALIYFSSAETPILAYLVGVIVAALTLVSRKAILALTAVFGIAGIGLAPLLPGALPDPYTEAHAYPMLSNSAVHRLAIWRTTVEYISKSPVVGIGLNGTRHLYGDEDKIVRKYATGKDDQTWTNRAEPIPLHAHNGILQIWLELGGLGALILAAMLLVVLWRMREQVEPTPDRYRRAPRHVERRHPDFFP